MRSKSFTLALGLVGISWATWGLPACSSDDESGGTSGKGGSGGASAGSGGTAGTAGSAGSAGTAGSSGTGTDGGSPPVNCGGTMCANPFGVTCCAGATQNKCGLSAGGVIDGGGCVETNQPGNPDPSCTLSVEFDGGLGDGGMIPADSGVTRDGGTITAPGCCRPDGKCGVLVDLGPINLGCIDPSQFGGDAGGAPRTCTPKPDGG